MAVKRIVALTVLALTLVIGASATLMADEISAFVRIAGPYEAIRQALLEDSMDGVADTAAKIEHRLDELEANFSVTAAGIRPDGLEELREILPELRAAAAEVGSADTLDDARESFGGLSKALVRYRALVADPAPVVAFCSMAQKVWLQPDEEIGNPYYGQSMARCGEIVSK